MSDAPWRSHPRIVSGLAVVVPAHDEEHRLAACIDSVHRALDHRSVRALPGVLVLVLDGCTDDSRRVAEARTRDGDVIVEVAAHNVGAARAHGSAIALESWGGGGSPSDARGWPTPTRTRRSRTGG